MQSPVAEFSIQFWLDKGWQMSYPGDTSRNLKQDAHVFI